MKNPIIALLTDFGYKDEYVGVLKAVLLKINPNVKIIDICHEIPAQDIIWAGILLKNSYYFFPEGTIFLCVVDPGVGTKRKIIIVKTKNYYFISPDNGLLTEVLKREKSVKIVEVKNKKYFLKEISSTFHGRDIMAPVAGYLSKRIKLSNFGEEIKKIKKIYFPKPIKKDKDLIGEIIHIDNFGNLVTNISKNDLKNIKITKIKIKNKSIFKINKSYAGTKKGELLAIWGSRNLLEISMNQESAEKSLKAKKRDKVKIELID
jgi:hypothetical protein